LFQKILQGKFIPLYKEDEELIEDLVITSRQTLELSKTTIKNISNAREAYTTILSNSLNKIHNHPNHYCQHLWNEHTPSFRK